MHSLASEVRRGLWAGAVLAALAGCTKSPAPPPSPPPTQPPPTKITPALVALCNEGVGLMGQFEYDKAHDVFARLAEQAPDWQQGQINLAIATLNRQLDGDIERAQAILRKVLAAEPDNLRAAYCLGLLDLFVSSPTDAVERFQAVASKDAHDAYAAYYLAQCLLDVGEAEAALAEFQRSRQLDPYLRSSYYGEFQALQRLQKAEEAREALDAFNRLKDNPQAAHAEFKYTRMGPKAMAVGLDEPQPQSAPLPAGPLFASPVPLVESLPAGCAWAEFAAADAVRPSITACDIDGDGQVDLFLASAVVVDGKPQSAIVWQRDGRRVLDLTHPLAQLDNVWAVLWGDYDNDGLVDAYFCRRGSNKLFRQVEAGKWEDVTDATGTAGGDFDTIDGAMVDLDHDGDLDLWLIRANGPCELLNNNLDGTFRAIAQEQGVAGNGQAAVGTLVADLDGDRDVDLVILHADPPHEVFVNDRLWNYHLAGDEWSFLTAQPIRAAVAADDDADGARELYVLGGGTLSRWARLAEGRWSKDVLLTSLGESSTSIAVADLSGTGRFHAVANVADGWLTTTHDPAILAQNFAARVGAPCVFALAALEHSRGPSVVAASSGQPPLVWSPGPGRHAFVDLAFTGQRDKGKQTRSNASGIGVRVAARSGSRWTIVDTLRPQSGPGQSLQPLPLGLGGAKALDFVSVDWPDGVFQTELAVGPGDKLGPLAIGENQRQTSSCPVLFVWDGQQYRFVTDLLGVGGLGFLIEPGTYAPVRPWERVALPADCLQPVGGRLRMLLSEPMEEVCYLDAVALVAIDLPPGWQMVLDERLNVGGAEPTGEPLFFRTLELPIAATNDRGQDVLALVAAADRLAAPPGAADPRFIGLCADHSITIELAAPLDAHAGRPVLVADGWIEYPYSQTMFAAWQAGAAYRAPSLEARGGDGRWQTIAPEFGYPAGMPRTMALPLVGLPPGCTALCLSTNQEIYWDRLAVAFVESCAEVAQELLPLATARVDSVGFPRRSNGPQRQPSYDFAVRSPTWDARTPAGLYTRFGPAEPLVRAADSACAIIGPGEAVALEFAAPAGDPPPGWTRQYVLSVHGWCKDMDLCTEDGETVGPLPAREGAAAAELERRDRLHERLNTRYGSGR